MKKTYVKPAMAVEMFNLTQSIARACTGVSGGDSNHWNEDTCGFWFSGVLLWNNGNCTFKVDEGASVEELCYNAPSGNYAAFSST